MMLRSQQAFWRDLPELLQSRRHRDKWVAYHGDQQIGIAKTKCELCLRCLELGVPEPDFYVGKIEDDPYPPWVSTPIEESLFEVTDEPKPAQPTHEDHRPPTAPAQN